jgi:uncharacterized membrane protein
MLTLIVGKSFAGTMTALPGIPGADEIAWDINDAGVAVGTAYTYIPNMPTLPVRWAGGTIEVLDGPLVVDGEDCPIVSGDARSISGPGTVAARIEASCMAGPTYRAATWNDDDGTWIPLPIPVGAFATWAPVSNANGDIAYQVIEISLTSYSVLYESGSGTVTPIPGTESCSIWAINNSGLATGLCGDQAMAWFDGESIVLDDKNGESSYGRGLNDLGTIVGVTSIEKFGRDIFAARSRALVWDSIDSSQPRVLRAGWATDVNNNSKVVGVTGHPAGLIAPTMRMEAVMWVGNQPHYLGTLGGPGSIARAINDGGTIVGASDTENLLGTVEIDHVKIDIYELDAFVYTP